MSQHTQGYMNNLRTKTDADLAGIKANLAQLIERNKNNQDKQLVNNYKWQLGLVNAELNRRNPKDRMQQVEGNKARPRVTFPEMLKKRTLDELNKLLAETEKNLEEFEKKASEARMADYEAKKTAFNARISAIKAEIKSRDKKVEQEVKQEINKGEGKFLGMDRSVVMPILIGGISGGLLSWGFKGKAYQWIAIGAVAGGAYVWYNKWS